MTQADLEARKNKYFYMHNGLRFIKPESQEEWIEYVYNHMDDQIDDYIIKFSIILLRNLYDNIPCDIIINLLTNADTPDAIINQIVSLTVRFSPRGEEFKEYWCNLNPNNQIIKINNYYKKI